MVQAAPDYGPDTVTGSDGNAKGWNPRESERRRGVKPGKHLHHRTSNTKESKSQATATPASRAASPILEMLIMRKFAPAELIDLTGKFRPGKSIWAQLAQ